MELKETHKRLYKMADFVVKQMRDHLKNAGKVNTGQLQRSIQWVYVEGGIEFKFDDYGRFVLSGRRPTQAPPPKKGSTKTQWSAWLKSSPKMPPKNAILKWLATPHGSSAYSILSTKYGGNLTLDSASFLISKSIKQYGIKPVDFYNPYINKLYSKESWHELEAAFVEDLENEFEKIIYGK